MGLSIHLQWNLCLGGQQQYAQKGELKSSVSLYGIWVLFFLFFQGLAYLQKTISDLHFF